jgi:glucose/arabinose dehydrogenase
MKPAPRLAACPATLQAGPVAKIAPIAPIAWLLAAGLLLAASLPAAVPTGFTDTLVTAVGSPTALAFTPDGRLLITQQGGSLRIFQGGGLLATPAITLASVCSDSERGLLGVAPSRSPASAACRPRPGPSPPT